ncbi:MAG: hypothetical protein J0L80_04920 [Chitinophagales bacterium]|nr:hypothetical protein [Chitinophagales bacterium]
MKKSLTILVLLLLCLKGYSQPYYRTDMGAITITGIFNGASTHAESKHLNLQVNYDNATFNMQLPVSSIVSNNDSLNIILKETIDQIGFTGRMNMKMDVISVPTKNHPKQIFPIEGVLVLNKKGNPIQFTAILEHINGSKTSCMLSGRFTIDLNDFGWNFNSNERVITIQFVDIILGKYSE